MDYDRLLDFCTTPKQEELVRAVDVCHGNVAGAVRMLGLKGATTNYQRMFRTVQERAAKAGVTDGPICRDVAPGFTISKISTLSKEGEGAKLEWVQQKPEAVAQYAAMQAAVEEICSAIVPIALTAPPSLTLASLLTMYTFTDYHINMLAWAAEGGADWDLKIAEDTGRAAMQFLTSGAPASEVGLINIQGDWQHFDGLKPITPGHGHLLDADSRAGKGIKVSIRLIKTLVSLALQKHNRVILLICEGNHDLSSSLWLRNMFAELYADEPRVEVPDSELPYYAIQWGNTALFFHHGHLKKFDSLPLLFATQFPIIWGATTKRYGNTGHFHHLKVSEFSGIKMMQHPTIAANDSHGARSGYHSEREMTAITFHKDFGKATETVVTPEMLEAS